MQNAAKPPLIFKMYSSSKLILTSINYTLAPPAGVITATKLQRASPMALSLITFHSNWGNAAKLSVDWNSPKRTCREFHCNRSFPGSAVSQWSMEKRRKQKFIERGRWSYGFLSGMVVAFCASSDADLIYSIRRSESSCRKSWPWQHTPGIPGLRRLTKKNLGVYDQAGPLQRSCLKCKKREEKEGEKEERNGGRKKGKYTTYSL